MSLPLDEEGLQIVGELIDDWHHSDEVPLELRSVWRDLSDESRRALAPKIGPRLLALLVAFHSTGCVALDIHCGGSYRVDSRFDAEQRKAIEGAAQTWNELGDPNTVVLSNSGRCLIERTSVPRHLSDYTYDTGTIRIDPQLWCGRNMACYQTAVTHELGHSLGLGHVAPPAVMSKDWSTDDFTANDLAECKWVGVCK